MAERLEDNEEAEWRDFVETVRSWKEHDNARRGGKVAEAMAITVLGTLMDCGKVGNGDIREAWLSNWSPGRKKDTAMDPLALVNENDDNLAGKKTAGGGGETAGGGDGRNAGDAGDTEMEDVKAQKEQTERRGKARFRHVALQFHYDGSNHSGFAQTMNSDEDQSIERDLFAALAKAYLIPSAISDSDDQNADTNSHCNRSKQNQYSRCGRTDRGVSAHGQVVALLLKSAFSPECRLPTEQQQTLPVGTVRTRQQLDQEGCAQVQDKDLPTSSLDSLLVWAPQRPKTKREQSKRNSKKAKKAKQQVGASQSPNGDDSSEQKASTNEEQQDATFASPSPSSPPASFVLRPISELNYAQILNNLLPEQIRVLGWSVVSSQFSARFSCSQRTYRYFFCPMSHDLNAMSRALQLIIGKHDFRNLCKMDCEQVFNFERIIHQARIVLNGKPLEATTTTMDSGDRTEQTSLAVDANRAPVESDATHSATLSLRDSCYIEIIGQAFLWHQIRCIVSILFMVGRGLERPEVMKELLDISTNPSKPSYPMASEFPLVLHHCDFGDRVVFGRSVANLWKVTSHFHQQWEYHALAAQRAGNAVESLRTEVATVRRSDVHKFIQDALAERCRKEKKRNGGTVSTLPTSEKNGTNGEEVETASTWMTWGEALRTIREATGLCPLVDGPKQILHIPLMERSKGTTYEEKIALIQQSSSTKRRERFEGNMSKRRKSSRKDDEDFYAHMLKQGEERG